VFIEIVDFLCLLVDIGLCFLLLSLWMWREDGGMERK
jgi:hypothetical protein